MAKIKQAIAAKSNQKFSNRPYIESNEPEIGRNRKHKMDRLPYRK